LFASRTIWGHREGDIREEWFLLGARSADVLCPFVLANLQNYEQHMCFCKLPKQRYFMIAVQDSR
jgi:hypothetical protein